MSESVTLELDRLGVIMMTEKIQKYLKKLQDSKKTLVTKISYEFGKPVSINEYSNYDQLLKKNAGTKPDHEFIAEILNEFGGQRNFCGFIAFELTEGKLTGYATYSTYRADTLRQLLGV